MLTRTEVGGQALVKIIWESQVAKQQEEELGQGYEQQAQSDNNGLYST